MGAENSCAWAQNSGVSLLFSTKKEEDKVNSEIFNRFLRRKSTQFENFGSNLTKDSKNIFLSMQKIIFEIFLHK